MLMFFFFFLRTSEALTIKKSSGADCSQERRGDSLCGSVCDPEELQAVDNEKISVLITSYKAALIPFNNPIGTHPCHCQTAVSAPLFSLLLCLWRFYRS